MGLPRNGFVQPVEGPDGGLVPTGTPNQAAFITGNKSVADTAVAERLAGASVPIPNGFSVFITFRKDNSGENIYIAESEAKANAKTNCKILNSQNAGIRLYITDVTNIWISVDTADDGADWIVEQES